MISILIVPFYALYNYILMSYAAYIYEYRKSIIKLYILCTIVGAFSMYAYMTYFTTPKYEFLMLFAYIILYSFVFSKLHESMPLNTLFGVFAFTLNFVSRRILTISVIAMIFDITMSEAYSHELSRLLAFIIPFSISSPYILATRKLLHKKYMDNVLMDKKNVRFAVSMMGYTCAFLAFLLFVLGFGDLDKGYTVIYLVVGIVTSFSYHTAIGFSYAFAKMQIHVAKLKDMKKSIEQEQKTLKALEESAFVDQFTGMLTRKGAEDVIDQFLAARESFYVIFFDMDGLKHVNDTYGHAEGDLYIMRIASLIKEAFKGDTISRFGGDEFVVVGSMLDPYSPVKKSVLCYESSLDISKHYDCPYPTSISYGINRIMGSTIFSRNDIIKEADERMYEFKKMRNKQRTTQKASKP